MCNCNNNCNCGCSSQIVSPCNVCTPSCPPTECECAVKISTDCSTFTGDTLPCTGIVTDTILTDVLVQMDAYICEAIAAITASINLVNVGTGSQVYKGIDNLGRREIRSLITTGNLLTDTQNTNDITFTIDEAALDAFIEANQLTYSVDNIGTGAEFYVTPQDPPVGDNTEFKLRTLVSDDILVEEDGDEIRLSLPSTSSIPDFIVNQDFPTTYEDWLRANTLDNGGTPIIGYQYKGYGTMAKPFVDTIVYTLGSPLAPPVVTADTSIQNALDAYVGNTLDPLNPQFYGARVKVQPTLLEYIFKGNLNYHGLKFNIQTGATITHDPIATTGEDSWLINLDHSDFTATDVIVIRLEIDTDSTLNLVRNGFKNKGTLVATVNFAISKIIFIQSEGVIIQTSSIDDGDIPGDYLVFNLNADATAGYENDANAYADIQGGIIRSEINPLIKSGVHVTDFINVQFSYGRIGKDLDPFIFPYENIAGAYTKMERCQFYNFGITTPKTLFKTSGVDTQFLLIEPLLNGATGRLLEIDTHLTDPDQDPIFEMYNGINKDGFTTSEGIFAVNLFGGRTAKWKRVYFNNNYISRGYIPSGVDMTNGNTQGTINFLGRTFDFKKNLVEFLPRFTSRAAAITSGADYGTRFTKYTTVTSGSFVVGEEYKIVNIADVAAFTAAGASATPAVGEWFVATTIGAVNANTADKEVIEIVS